MVSDRINPHGFRLIPGRSSRSRKKWLHAVGKWEGMPVQRLGRNADIADEIAQHQPTDITRYGDFRGRMDPMVNGAPARALTPVNRDRADFPNHGVERECDLLILLRKG